jgi:stage IV sporulation protein B
MGNIIKLNKKTIKKYLSGLFAAALISMNVPSAIAVPEERYLVPMGNAVGISLQSEGVMVVGMPEVLADGTSSSPARDAGISVGDIITQIGNVHVSSNEELKAELDKISSGPVSVKVTRGNQVMQFKLMPHVNKEGRCELGLWMRDGIAGIGTMTFYDPKTGLFGALGHSVNDIETGVIIPLRKGSVARSFVTDVVPGKAGAPGQLHGTFNIENALGSLTKNSTCGIFGIMEENDMTRGKTAIPVGYEIKTGPATILSNVSGTSVEEYKIEITRVYTGHEAVGRSMMISVLDQRLLDVTGGIVQGMSGSPIIQNGKIIGAVTHVLINDPTRGYGISINNMLDIAMEKTENKAA